MSKETPEQEKNRHILQDVLLFSFLNGKFDGEVNIDRPKQTIPAFLALAQAPVAFQTALSEVRLLQSPEHQQAIEDLKKGENSLIIQRLKTIAEEQRINIDPTATKKALDNFRPNYGTDEPSLSASLRNLLFKSENPKTRAALGAVTAATGAASISVAAFPWIATMVLGATLNPVIAILLLAVGIFLAQAGIVLFGHGLIENCRQPGFQA